MQIGEFDTQVELHRFAWMSGCAVASMEAALDELRAALDKLAKHLANEDELGDNESAQ